MLVDEATFKSLPPHLQQFFVKVGDEVLALFPQTPGQLVDASTSPERRKTQNVYGAMKAGNGRAGEASAGRRYTDEGATNFAALPGARRNDTGSAARFFNCFPPDADPIMYQPKAGKADRAGSRHPTVKPIALMRWLVRLVTPPGGRVLDPFAGSGATGAAALAEGFDCTLIEAEPEYVDFLHARFSTTIKTPWSAADLTEGIFG